MQKTIFTVNAPKFQVAAGRLDNVSPKLRNVSASLDSHGVVTVISLDDKELDASMSVLITAASSFRNTGMVLKKEPSGSGYAVVNPGTAPVLMKRLNGTLMFKTRNMTSPVAVKAIMLDGSTVDVPIQTKIQEGFRELVVPLGIDNTPWYWIKFRGNKQRRNSE